MSGRLRWEQDVAGCVAGRPHLLPIFRDANGVIEHLRDYNPDLFIVLNAARVMEKAQGLPYTEWTRIPIGVTPLWNSWYEVHTLHDPVSLVMEVPWPAMDFRIIQRLYETDIRLHGRKLLDNILGHNERLGEQKRKDSRRETEAMASDHRTAFARAAWGQSVFGPGSPSTGTLFAKPKDSLIATPAGVVSSLRG